MKIHYQTDRASFMFEKEKLYFSPLGLIIWFLASLFFLYEFFLRTFVGTIANQIMQEMHLTADKFALIGAAYYLAYAVMQVPVGILTDKFGIKRILLFAILVCAASAFLFSHANNFSQAFMSRIMMGFGSSFAFVCLLIISATWFPKKYYGFFIGASQFIGTMGPLLAAGPLVELLNQSHGNWRILLNEIGFAGIILAMLIFIFVKNKPRQNVSTLIYLTQPESVVFYLKQLIKNPQAWYIAFYSAMVYTSIALLGAIWGTSYLEACGLSQAIASHIISLAWLGYAIGCLLLGALSDLIKRRSPILAGSAMLGFITTIGIIYSSSSSPMLYALFFFGLGIAAAGQSVAFAAITEHVNLTTKATALGLNNGTITVFSTIAPLITGFFINSSQKIHGGHLLQADFIHGFSYMPILFLLAIIFSIFFIKETYCKPQKEMIFLHPKSAFEQ